MIKKTAFALVGIVLAVGVVEASAYVAGRLAIGRPFSLTGLQRQREALIASGGRATIRANTRWTQEEILHPYVGFTAIPTPGTPFGIAGDVAAAPPTRAPDRVVVAFVGGSFAQFFVEQGAPALFERLATLPRFRGKRFVALNLTMGGYKQPQQLMTMLYLLSVGATVDLIVNIDGFNDVAIHPTENAGAGVFPAYPRRWHQRMEGVLHGGALRLMVLRVQLEQRRAALAEGFSGFPWRRLHTANFFYAVADRELSRRMADTDMKLLGAESARPGPAVSTGPTVSFSGDAEMYAHLVALWVRGSRLLHGVARATDARYYHFLQPNQYVPGSKPMSAGEKARAWEPANPYRRIVETAYPMLRNAGRALAEDGVRFTDLTGIFAERAEPLYIDTCCHVGPRGNALLVEPIYAAIRADLEAAPVATGSVR